MHEFDHLLAAVILIASVVQAFADPETLKGLPKLTFFKAGAITGIIAGALVLAVWQLAGRPIADFGLFGWLGSSPERTAAAAVAWLALLLLALHLLGGRWRSSARRFYSGYSHLMPGSRRELGPSWAAGTLAGIGEEIAYRGFFLWYLTGVAGQTAAVLLSSVIFGVAHGYQGKRGMLFATVAGLILAGAYLATGSLLLLLWMHASYNIASFTLGYWLLFAPRPQRG